MPTPEALPRHEHVSKVATAQVNDATRIEYSSSVPGAVLLAGALNSAGVQVGQQDHERTPFTCAVLRTVPMVDTLREVAVLFLRSHR